MSVNVIYNTYLPLSEFQSDGKKLSGFYWIKKVMDAVSPLIIGPTVLRVSCIHEKGSPVYNFRVKNTRTCSRVYLDVEGRALTIRAYELEQTNIYDIYPPKYECSNTVSMTIQTGENEAKFLAKVTKLLLDFFNSENNFSKGTQKRILVSDNIRLNNKDDVPVFYGGIISQCEEIKDGRTLVSFGHDKVIAIPNYIEPRDKEPGNVLVMREDGNYLFVNKRAIGRYYELV